MKLTVLGLLILAVVTISKSAISAPVPAFGRYVGILHHEDLKRDQLAKLDFILSKEETGQLDLAAVITVHFGDFASGEYVSYRFDNVQYDIINQTLIFDSAEQEVTVLATKFADGHFEGELRSNYSGGVAKLSLDLDGTAKPQFPLIEPIWGEYAGKCEGVETRLQLETYRSTDENNKAGNPFSAYRIKGQLGEDRGGPCGLFGENARFCLWGIFDSGSYNFYESRIVLTGPTRSLICDVNSADLKCGNSCTLSRISKETSAPRALTPPTSKSAFVTENSGPALTVPATSLSGEYKGYVHHDYLDQYQPASINILAYQAPGSTPEDPKIRLSAVANLFFGPKEKGEAIAFRFSPRLYPNPLLAPYFVFRRQESGGDAILQVTQFGDGVIKGTWFSALFGKVGNFEFRKDGSVKLPQGAQAFDAFTGLYESNDWYISPIVSLGKTFINTQNPFFPLSFSGWASFKAAGNRIAIEGGSYDFFTGKLGLELAGKIEFVGISSGRGKMGLKKTRFAITTPMQRHELNLFRRVQ